MWWAPIVAGIFGLVGSLIGGGIVVFVNARNRAHQLEDKSRERRHLLTDKHQENLRHAYAEFIAAFARYLDIAGQFVAIERAIRETMGEAYEAVQRSGGAVADAEREARTVEHSSEGAAKSRQLMDQLLAASTNVDEKATNVLILENEETLREQVEHMVSFFSRIPEPRDRDYREYESAIGDRSHALNMLRHHLRGHFAPKLAAPTPAIEPPKAEPIEPPKKQDQLEAKSPEASDK